MQMQLKENTKVLVIIGSWNAKIILDPRWLKRFLFPNQNELKVNFPLGTGFPLQAASVETETIRMGVGGGRLFFESLDINNDTILEEIQDAAFNLADLLPHTPVQSFGINFAYQMEKGNAPFEIRGDIVDIFSDLEEDIKNEQIRYSIKLDTSTLNLTVKNGSPITWDFNFHHEVDLVSSIKEKLTEKTILEYRDWANNRIDAS